LVAIPLLPSHAQRSANIVVEARRAVGPVNRLVFGQNIEAADNARIFSSDTTDLNLIQRGEGSWDPAKKIPVPLVENISKAVNMTILRYPGGCLAHNFDWRKTVGPEAKKSGWLFGLDEYLSLCSAIGATPLITVSDFALAADQMPENSAELVEYLNSPADARHPWAMKRKQFGHPDPYRVVWFELGNESMHGNHRVLPHRHYSADQYAAYFNATAAAMRKVDPGIKLGLVLMPGAGTDVDCDWNHTVVHLAGQAADFAVVHIYTPLEPKIGVPENLLTQAMMAAPQQVEEHLAEYHRMIQRLLGHDMPLAITEFNGAQDQAQYRLSYGNALECADLLRIFLKPESNVVMANYFNFINGAFGMLRTTTASPSGEPATEEPAVWLYKLWAQHFGSQLVKVEVESPRAEFAGSGSLVAAHGESAEPRRQIQRFDLDKYTSTVGLLWPRLLDLKIQLQNSNLTIHMQNLSRTNYIKLAEIPRPAAPTETPVEFSVRFDAKFTPDSGSDSAPMGLGLMDSRGWNATHSGIGVDDISTDWKHLEGTYPLTAQTANVELIARLMADGKNVTGTLEVRNLEVTAFISPHDAAYPLLTGSASISADGKTAYLIVFNKSTNEDIPSTIHLPGFPVAKAQYWEMNAPSLASTTGVTETAHGASVSMSGAGAATHVFPAHSMTAIEFSSGR